MARGVARVAMGGGEQFRGWTHQHWGLEGPLPGQDLPFELERAQEFEHIGANREMGDITEDDYSIGKTRE